ncbi:MAG: hypothetical protein GF409_02955 [Candidatus Omnitrophica bacterium]|nr:hypothetical protein [Candidatus Omnitrophota bacterium]
MYINGTRNIMKGLLRSNTGSVLPIVLIFIALIALNTISLSTVLQRDVRLIRRIKDVEQARHIAEAGINHALADIKANGFTARSNFTGSMDTGSYSVTYTQSGGRHLVTSVGTVSGVSDTVSAEIKDNTPTALNFFSASGNDIRINSLVAGARIVGDIHANNNVYLKSGPLIAYLYITGRVSATDTVKEGTRYDQGSWDIWDNHVVINGDSNDTATVYEDEDRVTFPTFDFTKYQQLAEDSGDYYDTDQEFDGVSLSPGNGVVFVDGNVDFRGNCTLNGGLVADRIRIIGTLTVNKSGTRNVLMARNGNVGIFGRLYTEEALVYASQDIISLELLADIDINGIMMARRDIVMWNFITLIDYTYAYVSPSDMLGEDGEAVFEVVSFNQ